MIFSVFQLGSLFCLSIAIFSTLKYLTFYVSAISGAALNVCPTEGQFTRIVCSWGIVFKYSLEVKSVV